MQNLIKLCKGKKFETIKIILYLFEWFLMFGTGNTNQFSVVVIIIFALTLVSTLRIIMPKIGLYSEKTIKKNKNVYEILFFYIFCIQLISWELIITVIVYNLNIEISIALIILMILLCSSLEILQEQISKYYQKKIKVEEDNILNN